MLPSVVALASYVAASMPAERLSASLRRALLVGWIAQGISILIDVTGIGSERPRRSVSASRRPCRSRCGWCWPCTSSESQFVPLPGARRWLWRRAASWWSSWRGCSRARCIRRPSSVWAPSALAPRHRVVRALRRRRAARACCSAGRNAGCVAPPLGAGGSSLGIAHPAARAPHLPIRRRRLRRSLRRDPSRGVVRRSLALGSTRPCSPSSAGSSSPGLLAGRRAFGWRGPKAAGWLYAGAVDASARLRRARASFSKCCSTALRRSADGQDHFPAGGGLRAGLADSRRNEPTSAPARRPTGRVPCCRSPQTMLACAQCGMHLPWRRCPSGARRRLLWRGASRSLRARRTAPVDGHRPCTRLPNSRGRVHAGRSPRPSARFGQADRQPRAHDRSRATSPGSAASRPPAIRPR